MTEEELQKLRRGVRESAARLMDTLADPLNEFSATLSQYVSEEDIIDGFCFAVEYEPTRCHFCDGTVNWVTIAVEGGSPQEFESHRECSKCGVKYGLLTDD